MTTRNARIVGTAAVCLLCVIAGTGVATAMDIDRHFNESFDVEEGTKLVLDHGDGDVEITPWGQDRLQVEVRYRATGSGIGLTKTSDFKVDFRHEEDTVYVTGHEPRRVGIGISSFREHEYIYEIKAPDYLRLSLEGEDGDVEIRDWRGTLRLELEDGDVTLSNIEAPLTEVLLEDGDLTIDRIDGEFVVGVEDGDVEIFDCRSERGRVRGEDGDVTIERCSGSLDIALADGDARLTELAARELDLRGSDGNIKLELLPSDGLDLDARVGDGDVILILDRAVSTVFEFETGDGDIRVSVSDVEDLSQSRRRVTGRIGGGDGRIYVRTDDGSVTLRQ